MMNLYDSSLFFDEMFDGNKPKPHYRSFHHKLTFFRGSNLKKNTDKRRRAFSDKELLLRYMVHKMEQNVPCLLIVSQLLFLKPNGP